MSHHPPHHGQGKPAVIRPPAHHFRKSGWLPASQIHLDNYIRRMSRRVRDVGTPLLPAIEEFKTFIETNPTVYQEFIRMFEGATDSPKDYNELLSLFDGIFREAPSFGSLGPPVYMIMAQSMNTQGGFSAFTKDNLNYHFKKMFTAWAEFLLSPDSRVVLHQGEGGWLSAKAKEALMAEYGERLFEEVFVCDPNAEYYGYTSYEDFFNRRYANPQVDRPTGPISNLRLVSAACESTLYAFQENVQKTDELFIKDEAYSLVHLLANDPLTEEFVGGTIIQGFLNTTGYHRWHAPVNGTIKKIVDVPGTYFAQAPSTIGDPIPPPESDELPPYLKSLRYFANTAARQLIFIEADNKKIGLVCFVSIGMTEISTCEATVSVDKHVNRGEELGMFHFGGSTHVLVFQPKANLEFEPQYKEPGTALKINQPIAVGPDP